MALDKNNPRYLEQLQKKRDWEASYKKTDKWKAYIAAYRKRPENQAKIKAYYQSEKGRQVTRKSKNRPECLLVCLLRRRITFALEAQGGTKWKRTREITGCSPQELRSHLESKFTGGMTWENRGGINGWHIDHIIPCSSFNLTDLEQQKKCFHYTNLQPLWGKDNRLKSDKT